MNPLFRLREPKIWGSFGLEYWRKNLALPFFSSINTIAHIDKAAYFKRSFICIPQIWRSQQQWDLGRAGMNKYSTQRDGWFVYYLITESQKNLIPSQVFFAHLQATLFGKWTLESMSTIVNSRKVPISTYIQIFSHFIFKAYFSF